MGLSRDEYIDFVEEQIIPVVEEFASTHTEHSIVIAWHLTDYNGPLPNDKTVGFSGPNVIRIFITRKGNRKGDVNYPQLQIACNAEGAVTVWSSLIKNEKPSELLRTFKPDVELSDSYLIGFLTNQLKDQTL